MFRAALAAVVLMASTVVASAQPRVLVIAATTSVQDSGLFAYLAPKFSQRTGIGVRLISRSTGEALILARNGFVDVVIGNSPSAIDHFMDAGDGMRRDKMMFDDFVLAGPSADPAEVRGKKDVAEALRNVALKRSTFISRGDNSGTHALEMLLWNAAGVNPKARSGNWYRETGLGMGLSVGMAVRLNGYILVDRATWLAQPDRAGREILVEGDPRLFNQYEVIVANAERYPNVDHESATRFANWIASDEGQALIAEFKLDGNQVFFPNTKGQH
jgi:tungstate transport system substrate-binding protein